MCDPSSGHQGPRVTFTEPKTGMSSPMADGKPSNAGKIFTSPNWIYLGILTNIEPKVSQLNSVALLFFLGETLHLQPLVSSTTTTSSTWRASHLKMHCWRCGARNWWMRRASLRFSPLTSRPNQTAKDTRYTRWNRKCCSPESNEAVCRRCFSQVCSVTVFFFLTNNSHYLQWSTPVCCSLVSTGPGKLESNPLVFLVV